MSKLNIKPLADRVVVEPAAAEERTAGGIIIPDTAKEKPQKGVVVAVGNGKKDRESLICRIYPQQKCLQKARSLSLRKSAKGLNCIPECSLSLLAKIMWLSSRQ